MAKKQNINQIKCICDDPYCRKMNISFEENHLVVKFFEYTGDERTRTMKMNKKTAKNMIELIKNEFKINQ